MEHVLLYIEYILTNLLPLSQLASSASDEQAPPKPPRIERPPIILGDVQQGATTTYIVAQNPEILSQLMRGRFCWRNWDTWLT
jgi:hypothetical protein